MTVVPRQLSNNTKCSLPIPHELYFHISTSLVEAGSREPRVTLKYWHLRG